MHVLTLPPRHLLRVTLAAALLALALTALLAAPLGAGRADRASVPQARGAKPAATAPAASPARAVRPPLAARPRWLADPVAPPALGAPPVR